MSLRKEDLVKGTKLECTKAENNKYYTVGHVYEVKSVKPELVYLADNTEEVHPWNKDCLCDPHWLTTFKLV